jgi:hypothetical protein
MRRANKINAVYQELKLALGDTASSQELLEYSNSLVDLFGADESEPRFDLRRGGVKFEERSVDSVLADGGWKVLCGMPNMSDEHEELSGIEFQDAWFRSGLHDYFQELGL